MKLPTHRAEHTGDAGLDRIQENVRALAGEVRKFMARMARQQGLGLRRIVLQDRDYTLSLEEAAAAFWLFEGTLTAARTIYVPRAADADAYGRWIYNFTSGGQSLSIANVDGSDTVANGGAAFFVVYGSYGPEEWT